MCGIFGFIAAPGSDCDIQVFRGALEHLFRLSEPRGREASGLVIMAGGRAQVFKRPMAPSDMLASRDYHQFMESAVGTRGDGPIAAIGHCRLVTNGAEVIPGNNQPIIAEHSVGVHNGIVTNEDALWAGHEDLTRRLDTDSEIIFRLIDRHCKGEAGIPPDIPKAVGNLFEDIEGAASIAFFRDDAKAMTLATNTGSLYFAHLEDAGVFVFSSERFILQSFLKVSPFTSTVNGKSVRHLEPGTGCVAGFADAIPHVFAFAGGGDRPAPTPASVPAMTIEDHTHRVADIKRCTKCVLPATYPFIEFDADGVCNHCRGHETQKNEGRDALEAVLSKYRSADGSPDCIVAFSGGRDSSYGLHLIKRELGMNPVAFTYDWGMVTDIARRNQARMCGQLGVEHILRAADIPTKRRHIRKNIFAWLKRPELGMVPLFMAGDKFFYQYARELRKETGIKLVIFCGGNELERTDFKTGFAGVRESQHGQRLFYFSLANKMQLGLWYMWQYLRNPAYFNESFVENLRSFFETFVAKDDFLYLFHYIKWDEAEIENTLIGDYGWETAGPDRTTWRIGDGYTAFITYIYYTLAGFSEYDTFRSYQIRDGLITREQALRLVARDNEPPFDILYDFAKHTGFNLEEVMAKINSIPKLY